MVNHTKKTNAEKQNIAILRKQNQRERLRNKYSDEEYKQRRAKELAECRRIKREESL